MSAEVEIGPYEDSDLEAIVEFSLRAWQPVFEPLFGPPAQVSH